MSTPDHAAVYTALAQWWAGIGVTDVNGFVQIQTVPEEAPRPNVNHRTGAIVTFKIMGSMPVGGDGVRRATVVTGLQETAVGNRQLTVSVRVDSGYSQSPNITGVAWLEEARTRLGLEYVRAAFKAAGVSVVSPAGAINDLSYEDQGRRRSRAAMDLVLNAWASFTAPTERSVQVIESARVQSDDLENTDGTDHVNQIDITVTEGVAP